MGPLVATAGEVARAQSSAATLAARSGDSSEGTVLGWLVLVIGVLVGASLLPLVAALIRKRLPDRRLDPEVFPFALAPTRSLPSQSLGLSHRTRRSVRHAVAAHRTFLAATVLSAIGLVLLTLMPALPAIGESGLLVALALSLPALFVAWHGRQRDLRTLAESEEAPPVDPIESPPPPRVGER